MIPSEDWSWRLERSPSNEIVLPFVSPRTEIRRIKDNAFEVQTDRIGTCGGLVLQIIPFRILLEYEYNSTIDTTFNGNRKTFIVDIVDTSYTSYKQKNSFSTFSHGCKLFCLFAVRV